MSKIHQGLNSFGYSPLGIKKHSAKGPLQIDVGKHKPEWTRCNALLRIMHLRSRQLRMLVYIHKLTNTGLSQSSRKITVNKQTRKHKHRTWKSLKRKKTWAPHRNKNAALFFFCINPQQKFNFFFFSLLNFPRHNKKYIPEAHTRRFCKRSVANGGTGVIHAGVDENFKISGCVEEEEEKGMT